MKFYWLPVDNESQPTSNVSYFTERAAQRENPEVEVKAFEAPLNPTLRAAGVLSPHK